MKKRLTGQCFSFSAYSYKKSIKLIKKTFNNIYSNETSTTHSGYFREAIYEPAKTKQQWLQFSAFVGFGRFSNCFASILFANGSKTYSVMARMISISEDEFHRYYWPKLEAAINLILQQNPGEFIPISYEETYRLFSIECGFVQILKN